MSKHETFIREVQDNIARQGKDTQLRGLTDAWFLRSLTNRYTYNFSALGRPIIQYPQDMVAMQELIWRVRPDLIIETGVAHGGSLIQSAAMLALLDYCDAVEQGVQLDPRKPQRRVLGVDIEIRPHNRQAIEAHPMAHRIDLMQGSSIEAETIRAVNEHARPYKKILLCLDSNHTHEHVLAELRAYAPLTSLDSYCVVFDTVIEDLPKGLFPDRPWDVGNNPKSAVFQYLQELSTTPTLAVDGQRLAFDIDKQIDAQIMISVAPDGYLRRTRHET